jgi:dienelactone hydrolase
MQSTWRRRARTTRNDVNMMNELLEYHDGDVACEGYVSYRGEVSPRRPGVLVLHAWHGLGEFERSVADDVAALGYVGVALDVYGKGIRGDSLGDNSLLMQPYVDDRSMLRRRIASGLEAAQSHSRVDPRRIAAIGHCFGGMCALDLARSGARAVRGVVSVHGTLRPPRIELQQPMAAKVLLLHGYDDPYAPPADVSAIATELSVAQADWQLHAYGRVQHAFTSKDRNSPEHGLVYDATAARRAWLATTNFLDEVLGSSNE